MLEISGIKAPGGWNWMLRTYNLVPSSSKVVQLVKKGDVKGVRDWFTSRKASSFDLVADDKYPWGKSLFHVSMAWRYLMLSGTTNIVAPVHT